MTLLLSKLVAKPLDENSLRNHIGVEKRDQSDQTKDNIEHVDLEEGLRATTHCGETEGHDCKSEEKDDKNRVPPDPPIALLNFLKFARQLLVPRLHGSCDGMDGRDTHVVKRGGKSSPI